MLKDHCNRLGAIYELPGCQRSFDELVADFFNFGEFYAMENYNFWQDLFDTYQSLSEIIKILWLIVPPMFILALVAIILRYRLVIKQSKLDGKS